MLKMFALAGTTAASLLLSPLLASQEPDGPKPPPPPKKKPAPKDDLKKAYDAIRRLHFDQAQGGPAEDRLHDWTQRAAELYREGIQAFADGDERLAHEYGVAAHDLARAAEHVRGADRLDQAREKDDLPPPPGHDPKHLRDHVIHDLRHAHDRIQKLKDQDVPKKAEPFLDAARDLYREARQCAQDDYLDRAGELARAAEAMTHVPEHLIHIERGPKDPPRPRAGAEKKKHEHPKPGDAKKKHEHNDELPPPID